jgi:hypothetical protein
VTSRTGFFRARMAQLMQCRCLQSGRCRSATSPDHGATPAGAGLLWLIAQKRGESGALAWAWTPDSFLAHKRCPKTPRSTL